MTTPVNEGPVSSAVTGAATSAISTVGKAIANQAIKKVGPSLLSKALRSIATTGKADATMLGAVQPLMKTVLTILSTPALRTQFFKLVNQAQAQPNTAGAKTNSAPGQAGTGAPSLAVKGQTPASGQTPAAPGSGTKPAAGSATKNALGSAVKGILGGTAGQAAPAAAPGARKESREQSLTDMLFEEFNPEDKVTLNIPLFLRLMEYAKEDAKTDMDLHDVTEKVIALSEQGDTLTMDHYEQIVAGPSGGQDSEEPMKEAPEYGASKESIVDAIMGRIHHGHLDQALAAIREHGIESFNDAVESEASFHAGAQELGSSDISGMVKSVFRRLGMQESTQESITECGGAMVTPDAAQPQTNINVSKTTSDPSGTGSVSVSGNAKDTETLNQLLKLAGLNLTVSDQPPAQEVTPCGAAVVDIEPAHTVSIAPEFDDGPDMSDASYSTNGATLKDLLVNRMRDKFAQ